MPEARTTHKSPSECERNILSLSPPSLPLFITHSLFLFSFIQLSHVCLPFSSEVYMYICLHVLFSLGLHRYTVYSNIYQLSLFLFALIHCSVSFPLHYSKPSNLSLCQNSEGCNGRWNEQSEGTYICTRVCMCLTLCVKQVKIDLDICTESITG